MKSAPTLAAIRRRLRAAGSPEDAALLQGFFKTGPGHYGEGDKFLGVRIPANRQISADTDGLTLVEVRSLLHSEWHEERVLALLILVRRFERGDEALQQRLIKLYFRDIRFVNNWDLVDLSAPSLLGAWLLKRPRVVLDKLAASENLWERRIAVVATLAFIRKDQFDDTLRLCHRLVRDEHDLMHKACGWMLREVGKRDGRRLEDFLKVNAARMPRTMLRYAIERFSAERRQSWLARAA